MSSPALPTPDLRERLIVATWFYDEQPGFLDFKYRVAELAPQYRLTLVLRHKRFVQEFDDLDIEFLVLEEPTTGKSSLLRYCRRLAAAVRARRPAALLLLGSQLALARWLVGSSAPCLLYWNEHPTHFFGGQSRVKAALARMLVSASFAAAARCAVVMPIGEALREDLLARGVPAARVHLLYMGVAADFERGAAAPPPRLPPLRLVYAGSISPERGRDVMLDGLALARRAGVPVRLTLIGATSEVQAFCATRARQLGLDDALEVLGRVPGHSIPAHLAQAHLGICIWEDRPWWRFNPPTKLFEYLVAGLPVLASDIRTHTAYVQSGVNGWVFPYSAEGFAAALGAVWQRHAELPQWAEQARAGAQVYRWRDIGPAFVGLVRRVVAEGGGLA